MEDEANLLALAKHLNTINLPYDPVAVREIVDLLHFPLPEEGGPNPLVRNGRPDDIEPYLLVQLKNNLGDLANVDKVSVVGDNLTIQGTLASEGDRERFFSILRTMPLLRGFKVNARVSALGN